MAPDLHYHTAVGIDDDGRALPVSASCPLDVGRNRDADAAPLGARAALLFAPVGVVEQLDRAVQSLVVSPRIVRDLHGILVRKLRGRNIVATAEIDRVHL